jgi:DNA-binding MurR/RpiR family transcriptional regulator
MLIKIDHDFHERLTDTERNVINFINMNADKIAAMSISEVAEATFSSPATVSRTIKKCGISGFAELRYLLAQQAETQQDSADVNEIFNKSLLEVTNTIDQLSIDSILKAVDEILHAKRIYLLSRGLTELVAKEFELKLQLLGCNVFSNSDPLLMQNITANIKQGALVFIFSLSGSTPELLTAAENASSLGAHIISITCGSLDLPLVHLSHIALFGYKHQSVSIKGMDATSRFPLYVISRIIIDYLSVRKKQLETDHGKSPKTKKLRT